MPWFDEYYNDDGVVVSSRIRLARNIEGYPFLSRMDNASVIANAREICDRIIEVFKDTSFEVIDFQKISSVERQSYVEKHYVSPEFANANHPRVLIMDEKRGIAVMVCEEDHIRIQSIKAGANLEEALSDVFETDRMISEKLNIAFDEKYGYLTCCPTNLGTGMRASVMMFLPGLTMTKSIERLSGFLSKLGLTVRGLYGEGSEAGANIYQISNQVTLGITEEDTVRKLTEVLAEIIKNEKQARCSMYSDNMDRIRDYVLRSYGILKFAHMISTGEFLKLYSDVKLGIDLGIIKDVKSETLGRLFVKVMPANLILNGKCEKKDMNETERDKRRAEVIKKELNTE